MQKRLSVGLSSAALLAVLALAVRAGITADADLAGIRAVQSIASRTLDGIANAHTAIGQVIPTVLMALALAAIALRRHGPLAAIAPLIILVTGAVELALKLTTAHPPPGEEFVRAFMNPLGVRVHTPSAFPSGHVTRVTFLLIVASAMFPWRAWPAVALVAISASLFLRIYIGDHWPSDVLGGLLLGVACGAAAVALYQRAASKSSFARRK